MISKNEPTRGLREMLLQLGQWAAVVSLFLVPLNKPATNIALAVSLLGALCGRDTLPRWKAAARQPVVQGALIWWCVLALSALHTWFANGRFPIGGSFMGALYYPLIFGSLLQTAVWRQRGLYAFASAVSLVLLISICMYLGWVPQRDAARAPDSLMSNTVFKEYTQQGFTTLILGAMAMSMALLEKAPPKRLLYFAVATLAVVNAIFMLQSRTVVLVLVPLIGYWAWRATRARVNWRSAGMASVVIAALVVAACFTSDRMTVVFSNDVPRYAASREPSSTGIRLELWRRTLPIIAAAPVWGHGLGQWQPLYRQAIEQLPNFNDFNMGHPHHEMLLILSEQGTVGLLIYLALLVGLARYILRLDQPERDIYSCLLLAYLSAGLVNCLWADFSHRHVLILLLACIPLTSSKRFGTGTASGPMP